MVSIGLIGDYSVAQARECDEKTLEGIAQTVSLSIREVKARIASANGHTLIRSVFVDEWPDLATELSWYTVASARNVNLAEKIAQVTNLDICLVRMILHDSEGRMKVDNAFAAHWPGRSDREASAEAQRQRLNELSVAQARDYDLYNAIAEAFGCDVQHVRSNLETVHGRTRLRNVALQSSNASGEARTEEADDNCDLFERRVSWAQANDAVDEIVKRTNLSQRAVRRRLNGAHGNTILKKLFTNELAQNEGTERDTVLNLFEHRVSWAHANNATEEIAKCTGLSTRAVNRRLNGARGNTLLKNIFSAELDIEETNDQQEEDDTNDILDRRVSWALVNDVVTELARRTNLSAKAVQERLEVSRANSILRNIFVDELSVDDDADPQIGDLFDHRVSWALANNAIAEIAARTSLPHRAVQRALDDARGNTLLRTVFANEINGEDDNHDEPSPQPFAIDRGRRDSGSSARNVQSVTREDCEVDFAILTAIEVERRAVCAAFGLGDGHRVRKGARVYWRGRLLLQNSEFYEIIVAQAPDMANVDAALLTNDTIHHWSPKGALLVGIAGSVDKSVLLGDVIVGRSVYYDERGKVTPNGILPEPELIHSDSMLFNVASSISEWTPDLKIARPDGRKNFPRLHYGIIASSERVIADAEAHRALRSAHRKVLAVEMEGHGFSRAVLQSSDLVRHLPIRAICDEANETKRDEWHPYAAAVAADFARHFLLDRPIEPRNKVRVGR